MNTETGYDIKEAPLASLGDRLIAQIIDTAVSFGIVLASAIPFFISERLGFISIIIGCMLAVGYYLFADGLEGGQSYGKRIMNTAVVYTESGRPCSYWGSLLRNISLSVLGIIDWIFIIGDRRQRLGDMIANTRVVKIRE